MADQTTLTGSFGAAPASDSASLEEARARLPERFELRERLGHGGMGTVFTAFDHELEREVAVKLMRPGLLARPGARERFLREAQIAAQIHSPHLVSVFDVDANEGWIAMERIEGKTLADRIRVAPLDADELRQVGAQLLTGIAALHRAGVVHRDVKPANVFLDDDGRVRLGDFGVAHTPGSELTETGDALGTLGYMAPEQMRGQADPRSDIYGASATLATAATGKPLTELTKERGGLSAALARSCGPRLAEILDRGLALDPTDRWSSADELAKALARPARPASRAWWAALVALVLAVGSAIAWASLDHPASTTAGDDPILLIDDGVASIALLGFDREDGSTSGAYPYLLGLELAQLEDVECVGYYELRARVGAQASDEVWAQAAREAGARYLVHGRLGPPGQLRVWVTDLGGETLWSTTRRGDRDALVAALPSVARAFAEEVLGREVPPRPASESPPDIASLRHAARRALRAQDFDAAEAAVEQALLIEPDDPGTHYLMAMIATWRGADLESARYHARRASSGPLDAGRRAALTGMLLRLDGELSEAAEALERAAEEHPGDEDILYELFEALFHSGRTAEALRVHERLLRVAPSFALGLSHVSEHYLSHGDEAGIEAVLRLVRALDAPDRELVEARALFARRQHDAAIRRAQAATDVGGGARQMSTATRRFLVGAHLTLGHEAIASALADRMLVDDPTHYHLVELTRAIRRGDASAIAARRAGLQAHLRQGRRRYTTHLEYVAIELALEDERSIPGALELLRAVRRPEVRTAVADVLGARVLGDTDALREAAEGPYEESRQAARASLAEARGELDDAADAWAAAAAASNDGSFLLHHRANEAEARLRAGQDEAAEALCRSVLVPTYVRWSDLALAPRCEALLSACASARAAPPSSDSP